MKKFLEVLFGSPAKQKEQGVTIYVTYEQMRRLRSSNEWCALSRQLLGLDQPEPTEHMADQLRDFAKRLDAQ